ncbi:MAG: ATP-binding protein [Leptolyngbyaceae bacterium]|nr:ATP-binding protein [Leptolyngbyaceae bacterium]
MKNPWTLLIVDDSSADRAIYKRYLSQDPHQSYIVVEASYGQEGLDICKELDVDAILLDLLLPDMSGLQVLGFVQQHYPQIAVVMLTAHGDEQVAVRAMKAGAQDYLVKDQLKKDTLQHTTRNVIHQAQLQHQLRKNQEQQLLISRLAFQIRQSLELEETLNTAVTEVRYLLECDRALIYQFSKDMSGTIIAESTAKDVGSVLHQTVTDTYFQTHGAEEYCQGRKMIVADIYTAGLDPCHVDLLEQFNVKASLVIPILTGGDRHTPFTLWGLLVAHQCSSERHWRADEIQVMDALSIHLSIAIRHAELLAQTQAALDQEKALTAFKSQIIATVSHEYNSPLAVIQLAVETLKEHYHSLNEATREQLMDVIEKKTKHLSTLVNDMLLANQAELSQLKLKPTAIDLKEFLSKLIEEHELMGSDRHTLSLNVRGEIEGFVGDFGLLKQLFGNLLSNAIKYSPEGGHVRILLRGDATHLTCQIKDEGIGIPQEDQKRLFQPFSRASNVRSIAGTGLGLHIVKVSTELHGGTIHLESQEGKGTCFSVSLPKHLNATGA